MGFPRRALLARTQNHGLSSKRAEGREEAVRTLHELVRGEAVELEAARGADVAHASALARQLNAGALQVQVADAAAVQESYACATRSKRKPNISVRVSTVPRQHKMQR